MSLSSVFCGEIKIALDICRDLGSLSVEKRKLLPKTMGERLKISAFTTEQERMSRVRRRMEICTKCREMWPILEALYWSVRVSGMDISAIERLST